MLLSAQVRGATDADPATPHLLYRSIIAVMLAACMHCTYLDLLPSVVLRDRGG